MHMQLGHVIQLTLFGTSHGPFVGATLEGVPSGIALVNERIQFAMDRRKTGGSFSSKRKETDEVIWMSGFKNGKTDGSKIECRIMNQDARSTDYGFLPDHPRPGHQDLVMHHRTKGTADLRGGGMSSARLTAPIVAMGALLSPWLNEQGVDIKAHVHQIGAARSKNIDLCPDEWETELCAELKCRDSSASLQMKDILDQTRKNLDSIGSSVECRISGLPIGIGEPWFDGLEPALARAMMAIPAARGVQFGYGFDAVLMNGSSHNGTWGGTGEQPILEGERPDGALAGLSTGAPVSMIIAFKPPSSIAQPQMTLNMKSGVKEPLLVKGRHDPVLAPRAVAVVEALTCIVLADLIIRERRT